jgi:hypothetical protein
VKAKNENEPLRKIERVLIKQGNALEIQKCRQLDTWRNRYRA